MTVLAGALLGLVGSGHCVAMCGPLLLVVGTPDRRVALPRRLVAVGSYHAGRVTTYAVLGTMAGAAGSAFTLAGLGRPLAIGVGLLLLVAALGPAIAGRSTGRWVGVAVSAGAAARRWQARHRLTGPLVAGLANGLLPCGMVFAALSTALAAGTPGQAALTMTAFGLGTVPALAGLSLGVAHVPTAWRHRWARAAPVALALVGVLMLGRGLMPPATTTRSAVATAPAHLH